MNSLLKPGDDSLGLGWKEENELGLTHTRFKAKRSPKAFIKKYGYQVIGHILEKEVQDGFS